jgi:parallel beta-helix repeat protein
MNDLERRALLGVAGLGAVGALAALAKGGPLTPPAGPVASTNKTLGEIEPRIAINATNTPGNATSTFIISQPGSYYLAAPLVGEANKHGIVINASGVTIDLNGFELTGVPGAVVDGIRAGVFDLRNICVHSGSVANWTGHGINLLTSFPNPVLVHHVLARANVGYGIRLGSASTVHNCVASFNTEYGISVDDGSSVIDCVGYLNTGVGISADAGGLVRGCTSYFNSGNGINLGSGGSAVHCNARNNGGHGIRLFVGGLALENTCRENNLAGVNSTSSDNRIEGNHCAQNDTGILVSSAGNIIVRNTCCGSTSVDWNIAANNVFGTIVDRRTPASAAVNGFAAASTLASTDPWANFSH